MNRREILVTEEYSHYADTSGLPSRENCGGSTYPVISTDQDRERRKPSSKQQNKAKQIGRAALLEFIKKWQSKQTESEDCKCKAAIMQSE